MNIDLIGWDIGGAHLKAVALSNASAIVDIRQYPCPLWLGLDRLERSLSEAEKDLGIGPHCRHAVTMTGELTDYFEDRATGVQALLSVINARFGADRILVFAGPTGFLRATEIAPQNIFHIASANWLASALFIARQLPQRGLLIDIGSTTTDLVPFVDGKVHCRGYTDYDRLRYDELLYTGVVRTPAMTLADCIPFEGERVSLMAEHFATTADIYRLTGELVEHTDQIPAADGGDKTVKGSMRRLARLLGRDQSSATTEQWLLLARCLRERQIARISSAIERQLSRGLLPDGSVLVGGGIGRFLVKSLATRMDHPYLDAQDVLPRPVPGVKLSISDCLPAAAVASLAFSIPSLP